MATSKDRSKGATLAVLKAVTKFVGSMSQDDLDAFVSGKARLVLTREVRDLSQAELGFERHAQVDLGQLVERLRKAETTNEGFSALAEANLTRAELERVARSLDLSIMKQDSVRRLEDKIVEGLIGSRLNSRAVRGS